MNFDSYFKRIISENSQLHPDKGMELKSKTILKDYFKSGIYEWERLNFSEDNYITLRIRIFDRNRVDYTGYTTIRSTSKRTWKSVVNNIVYQYTNKEGLNGLYARTLLNRLFDRNFNRDTSFARLENANIRTAN